MFVLKVKLFFWTFNGIMIMQSKQLRKKNFFFLVLLTSRVESYNRAKSRHRQSNSTNHHDLQSDVSNVQNATISVLGFLQASERASGEQTSFHRGHYSLSLQRCSLRTCANIYSLSAHIAAKGNKDEIFLRAKDDHDPRRWTVCHVEKRSLFPWNANLPAIKYLFMILN